MHIAKSSPAGHSKKEKKKKKEKEKESEIEKELKKDLEKSQKIKSNQAASHLAFKRTQKTLPLKNS